MRETIWLWLRTRRFLRKLYDVPIATGLMKTLSQLVVPIHGNRRLRVRRGPGEGLIFELNPRWETDLWLGQHEFSTQQALFAKLRPGAVFYDVGAGFGFYSLMAARAGALVFAFEPDVRNAESLQRHAMWNSLEDKIQIVRSAVLSKTGHAELEPADFERGHGNAHVLESVVAREHTVTIPCTSLDEFARTKPLPDIIKIDVEGSESEVLKGSQELLGRSRADVICEVHDAENASIVVPLLTSQRYAARWLDDSTAFPKHLIATSA